MSVLRKAGQVRRFHTVQTIGHQTVAEHSFNVCLLLLSLTDRQASANLLKAALYHDLPELETGDIPATAKWNSPELAGTLQVIEERFETLYALETNLTKEEQFLLKFADMLELIYYCLDQLKLGNRNMYVIAERGLDYLKKMSILTCQWNCNKEIGLVTGKIRKYDYD